MPFGLPIYEAPDVSTSTLANRKSHTELQKATTGRPVLAHFQRIIQARHYTTPTTPAAILHWSHSSRGLIEWRWPVDRRTRVRIPPSELEQHRRDHYFRAPSCLCAYLSEEDTYVESRIGVVNSTGAWAYTSSFNGEYAAECATRRCGYFICLERFYMLPALLVRRYIARQTPLTPAALAYIGDHDEKEGDGLHQCMPVPSVTARGTKRLRIDEPMSERVVAAQMDELTRIGLPEDEFWSLFTQCYRCRLVVMDCSFSTHRCKRTKTEPPQLEPDSDIDADGESYDELDDVGEDDHDDDVSDGSWDAFSEEI